MELRIEFLDSMTCGKYHPVQFIVVSEQLTSDIDFLSYTLIELEDPVEVDFLLSQSPSLVETHDP